MAKIARANQKIFAEDAGANQIGQFGSFAAGSVAYTTSPEVIQALAEYDEGWFSAVVANNSPCIEDVNALDYLFSYQLAYGFQSGIPEWDDATPYYIGSFASDGAGGIYVSKTDGNTNHAVTDTTNWSPVVVTTPSTGGQVYGMQGSTNAGLTYRYYVPTAASTTPSAVITSPYLEFTSQSANGAPGLLGNQNGATPDAGLFFIGATKDANTVGDMRFDVRENDNSAYATTTSIAFRWSTFGTTLATILRNGSVNLGPTGSSSSALNVRVNTSSASTLTYATNDSYGMLGIATAGSGLAVLGNTQTQNVPGLTLESATHNTNSGADQIFRIRENDNTDYATLTTPGWEWRRFTTVVGNITRAGAFAFGPDGVATQHLMNGELTRKGTSGTAARLIGGASDTSENWFYVIAGTGGAKFRKSDNSANVGEINGSTGAWSISQAVTNNYTGAVNTLNGFYYSGNVTSTTNSGQIGFGANVRFGTQNAHQGRTNNATGGAGLLLLNQSNDTDQAAIFYANAVSDSTSTTATAVGLFNYLGRWTKGPTGGLGTSGPAYHTVHGSTMFGLVSNLNTGTLASNSTMELTPGFFRDSAGAIKASATQTGYSQLRLDRQSSAGSIVLQLAANYQDAQTINTAIVSTNTKTIFTVTAAGALVWGGSGFDINAMTIQNDSISNSTVVSQNLSTNASSTGGTSTFLAIKGTNTDSGQTFFSTLRNGGSAQNGTIQGNGSNSLQFVAASDERLKENIVPMTGAFDKIMAMKPVFFSWKPTYDAEGELLEEGKDSVGWIAQKMEEVFPENVNVNEDGFKHIGGWSREHSWIVGAFQEFVGKVKEEHKELKETVAALLEKISNLESRLSPA